MILIASTLHTGPGYGAGPAPQITEVPGSENANWLRDWLAGELPGTRKAKAPQAPPMAHTPANRSNPAELPRDAWLENWLSSALPGRPQVQPKRPTPIPSPAPEFDRRHPSPVLNKSSERKVVLPGISLTLATVASTGETTWNHDATSSSAALGNPTSELTYSDTIDLALELSAEGRTPTGYFARGSIGIGVVTLDEGNFRDDDFLTGQSLFSSTESVIPSTDLFYASLDVGKEIHVSPDRLLSFSIFAGIQYWREEQEAYGLYNRLTGVKTRSEDTLVIKNLVEWTSIRLGAITTMKVNEETNFVFDLAFVPFANMHNEDSHVLRTSTADLGPTPNVIMDGTGYGFEGSVSFTHYITSRLALISDFRYWHLMSSGDLLRGPDSTSPSTFPLNDLDTTRFGLGVGLKYFL